jgi:hypothetical protein
MFLLFYFNNIIWIVNLKIYWINSITSLLLPVFFLKKVRSSDPNKPKRKKAYNKIINIYKQAALHSMHGWFIDRWRVVCVMVMVMVYGNGRNICL